MSLEATAHATKATCSGGIESAIHLAAKQLIADRRALYLPNVEAVVSGPGILTSPIVRRAMVRKGALTELQDVRLEEKMGAIRPDLIVSSADEEILVEIANTSFVTPEKLAHIRQYGIATVEFDVSDLLVLNFDELAKRLFKASPRATWKFHPAWAAAERELQPLLAADQAEDRSEWEKQQEEQAQIRARAIRVKAAVEQMQRENHSRHALHVVETIAKPHEQKLAWAQKELGDVANGFLPIAVRGGGSVNAPLLVWQSYAFAALIHPALKKRKATLDAADLRTWLSERFAVDTSSSSLAVAVWDFLSALANMGILHKGRKQEFKVAVPDVDGASEVASDARENSTRELIWGPTWPSQEKAHVVAKVFAEIYGQASYWERVAGLLSSVVQYGPPADTVSYYRQKSQGAMDGAALRRYFLSAGFMRLKP